MTVHNENNNQNANAQVIFPDPDLSPPLPSHGELLAQMVPYREKWKTSPRPAPEDIVIPKAGQELVWDYPRPPMVRRTCQRVTVRHGRHEIANSLHAQNIIETSGAPVHYIPPEDVRIEWLEIGDDVALCEWKGASVNLHLHLPDGEIIENAAFVYPDPLDDLQRGFSTVRGFVGFYPAKVTCLLDGIPVAPQPGGYYAGWVSDHITGPIKGLKGSEGW